MKPFGVTWLTALTVGAVAVALPLASQAQWKISGPEGTNSFIKIGFLAQGQVEWLDQNDVGHVSQNIFIRRIRIIMGGNITNNLSFFFETDSPNIGKYDAGTKKKNEADIFIQDLYTTYSFGDEFKVDGGLMLMPLSHNHLQGATTLLPIDYGPFTFVEGGPTQERVGRDYGVQARGYLFDKHLEYRAGVFQGNRDLDTQGRNVEEAPFRYVGRIVFHVLEPEDSFFYTGTTLGKKNILSVGGSIDLQDTYRAYAGDLFWDQPIGDGDCFTLQFDYTYLEGDPDGMNNPYRTLYAQNNYLGELGYYNAATRFGLFGQFAEQNFVQVNNDKDDPWQDERRWQAGLVYWGEGHNWNVKMGYGILYKDHAYKKPHLYRDQYVIQAQMFMF
jgi:hypothetical protein